MTPEQAKKLRQRLNLAEAELKMRERNRNASEKGYRRVLKTVQDLKAKLDGLANT